MIDYSELTFASTKHQQMAQPIHVLLFDLPQLLSDILVNILRREADFKVRVQSDGSADLVSTAKKNQASIVVTNIEDLYHNPMLIELLKDNPRMKIFNIRSYGRETCLCELHPDCHALGQLAPDELVAQIHDLVDVPFSIARRITNRPDSP